MLAKLAKHDKRALTHVNENVILCCSPSIFKTLPILDIHITYMSKSWIIGNFGKFPWKPNVEEEENKE